MTASALDLATRNSAVLLEILARTRPGGVLVRRPGFRALDGPRLLRVLLQTPDPAAEDMAELGRLVARARARVTVEDPYSVVDLEEWGLVPDRLPVMYRPPAPVRAAAGPAAVRVRTAERLADVERVVVEGFPLPGFTTGEAIAPALLEHSRVTPYLVERDGVAAGACLSVVAEGVGGVYWVTTLPEHRSRGVGKALMRAVLADSDVPYTLTATEAGRPLYDAFGFTPVATATWWTKPLA
ncbi:GNAT family N-acetyltransferase [Saccharothrix obliqua]|uniref:GNAT family N-acetyltransferase n=1 Tax=Saccharothrix obliqua TaxID=2861747 RepID=UPI001C5E6F77|nr:GNAT family N-acetyltransferase [Saccharothrix obliqua]MBW4717782.1 GNAT family N-acetyltransferase [Saccharothrix obliqua]